MEIFEITLRKMDTKKNGHENKIDRIHNLP